jgi:protein-tyrosine-phosphatase
MEAVHEQIGIDVHEHQTIQVDERYWRRAQLILAMDANLLRQLPPTVGTRAELFTAFYGGKGNIVDPYGLGIDAYQERCREIRGFIDPGIESLVRRLAAK